MGLFRQFIESQGVALQIPIKKIYGWRPKAEEALKEVQAGSLSYSHGAAIMVSRLDTPKGCFFIIDGYHRAFEAILKKQTILTAVINPHIPRIERTGGAYTEYINNKILLVDVKPRGNI